MSRPRKNPISVDLICETCVNSFSVTFVKRFQRFCSRSCSQGSPLVQQKSRDSQIKTSREKYGVDHPMMTSKVVEKFKSSMLKKHGVEHALQKKKFVDKCKNTSMEKHGDSNYRNVLKYKKTCLEKYGVDNFVKTDSYKQKYEATCLNRYGKTHASKTEKFKLEHTNTMFQKFLQHDRFVNFDPMFVPNEYFSILKDTHIVKYKFKCKRCNTVDSHNLNNGNPIYCINCDKNNMSYFQKEIYDYVKSIVGNNVLVESNNRTLMSPQGLDIYIPSLNVAIECNGIYWHSEVMGGKNKVYHLNKTEKCIKKGVALIHIYENEWNLKTNIVKSILGNIFHYPSKKIHARECEVKSTLSNSEIDLFINNNHIQGAASSSVKLGLYHKGMLISIMTFGKPRFDKKYEWEIVRYCTLLNHSVSGGASKLFKHFIRSHNPNSVVTYSDRRYFSGKIYNTLGFSFITSTSPNYWYVIDNYKTLKNRVSFQKHKLKHILSTFNPNLTEWNNMKNNGFDRVWDCGNGKWAYYKL